MKNTDAEWVLITGASGGFGEEFARQFAAQGRPLILVARRRDKMESLAQEIRERYKTDVIVEQVDLAIIEAVSDLHRRLKAQNIQVDTLVNNAGYGLQGRFLDHSVTESLNMINLDIGSLTAVTRVFAEDMKNAGKGHILMVASLLSYQGVKNFAVYSAAKSYVLRFSEALHRELKTEGITVTALCPGMSDTGFAAAAHQKLTPMLKSVMMKPAPVVKAGINALAAGKMSVVPGMGNKAITFFTWATPRRLHQAVMSYVMGV
ncbi:SDR family oxidoreductase [Pantoea sp. Seng]|uniref:SDR family NAD(P)-dependent oxidoreductase n=1 Tax=Pantoea sp. Seng TaxID=2576761 RepID=UPI00132C6643|nr:SDR family oxidoreductase [Pantoea sp. Seng]MXP53981.1 SDR family oxidoreductase [Pantoea sp. Seng]